MRPTVSLLGDASDRSALEDIFRVLDVQVRSTDDREESDCILVLGAGRVPTTRVPIVWRPGSSIETALPHCRMVVLNEERAKSLVDGVDPISVLEVAEQLRRAWAAESLAVTLGAHGASLVAPGSALFVPTVAVPGSVSGAGQAFLAAVARSIAIDHSLEQAVRNAVAFATEWAGREISLPDDQPGWTSPPVGAKTSPV